MKSKYLAFGLSGLLALSLVSCGGQQAQEPQEPTQEVQQAEPISTQPVVAPEEVKQEIVPTASETVPEEGQSVQDGDTSGEIDGTGEIEPAEEDQLFAPVEGGEEMVYATGGVNIRASWSVESEKLGSLGKGESVVRTGIAIQGTEAEGWSRVKISDGKAEDGTEQFRVVYVSNKYISTTKPAAQQTQTAKPSGGQQQTQQPQSGGSQQQTQKPSSGGGLEALLGIPEGQQKRGSSENIDWSQYQSGQGHQLTGEEAIAGWQQ